MIDDDGETEYQGLVAEGTTDITRIPRGYLADGRPYYKVRDRYYLDVYTPDPAHPVRTLPDGREIVVVPHGAGGGQLGVTVDRSTGGWDDTWFYDSARVAVDAAWAWDGHNEPAGWNRHPWTGRRRPDGTPTTELIRP